MLLNYGYYSKIQLEKYGITQLLLWLNNAIQRRRQFCFKQQWLLK